MKLYDSLPQDLADWVQLQPVFFTGSASTHGRHINVSPKGLADSHFAVLDANTCAYIDRTGSGCETIAHSYENGRLCLMFMSFGESPRILRLFCNSRIVEWDRPEFRGLVQRVAKGQRDAFDGARAVIIGDIWQVQTSCGFGVPRVRKDIYAHLQDDSDHDVDGKKPNELTVFETRPTLDKWAKTKVDDNKMDSYQNSNNLTSMDGLPGLRTARRNAGQALWLTDLQAWMWRIWAAKDSLVVGFLSAVLLYCILHFFSLSW